MKNKSDNPNFKILTPSMGAPFKTTLKTTLNPDFTSESTKDHFDASSIFSDFNVSQNSFNCTTNGNHSPRKNLNSRDKSLKQQEDQLYTYAHDTLIYIQKSLNGTLVKKEKNKDPKKKTWKTKTKKTKTTIMNFLNPNLFLKNVILPM